MARRNMGLERAEEARARIRRQTGQIAQEMKKKRVEKEMSVASGSSQEIAVEGLGAKQTEALLNSVLSYKNRKPFSSNLPNHFEPIPRILTKNGSSVSIQAGEMNYSSPKAPAERYSAVELGFIESKNPLDPEFSQYFDGSEESYPSEGVFGYVPMELVVKWIIDNGGLATENIDPRLIPSAEPKHADFGSW